MSDDIKLFEGNRIRSSWDNEEEEWYFSIIDILGVLTESENPRKYWSVLKTRLKKEGNELATICSQLKMKSPKDGKMYKTDVADVQGIFRIIQSVPSPKAEPFKMWLAEVGKERIDETIDPELTIDRALETYLKKGYTREWINQRLQAIQVRKELTDSWQDHGVTEGKEYAILTNEISKAWSGMITRQYKDLKGLKNMDNQSYWNHNTAYYKWIEKRIHDCGAVLDVGCGDGFLISYLDDGKKKLTGIDLDKDCITKAQILNKGANCTFLCGNFVEYNSESTFDAVIFVASIHHMDMKCALEKAKALLSPGGRIIIVGLAKPSTFWDYTLEALCIIPSKVISIYHNMKSSEDLNIPTSYNFPKMTTIHDVTSAIIPNAKIRNALHYRYLLEWIKS